MPKILKRAGGEKSRGHSLIKGIRVLTARANRSSNWQNQERNGDKREN